MKKESILGNKRILFLYSSSHLTGSNKVKFFYALKGRDKKLTGLVNNSTVFSLSKKILIADPKEKENIESFLNYWGCSFSIISSKNLKDKVILSYDSSSLTSSEQVKFFYALKGRKSSKGILESTKSIQLARGILVVPKSSLTEISQFFEYWNCKTKEVSLENE